MNFLKKIDYALIIEVIGVSLVTSGLWMLSVPVALIALGGFLVWHLQELMSMPTAQSACQQFMLAYAFSVTQSARYHLAHMFAVVALAFLMQQHMVKLHIG
jgi:hypothetical protein